MPLVSGLYGVRSYRESVKIVDKERQSDPLAASGSKLEVWLAFAGPLKILTNRINLLIVWLCPYWISSNVVVKELSG